MVPEETAGGPIAIGANGQARVSRASRTLASWLFCTSTFWKPLTAMPTLKKPDSVLAVNELPTPSRAWR